MSAAACTILYYTVPEKKNEKICRQTSKEQSSKQEVQTLRPPFSRWSHDRESSRANISYGAGLDLVRRWSGNILGRNTVMFWDRPAAGLMVFVIERA